MRDPLVALVTPLGADHRQRIVKVMAIQGADIRQMITPRGAAQPARWLAPGLLDRSLYHNILQQQKQGSGWNQRDLPRG